MLLVWPDCQRLTPAVRVDEADGHKVGFGDYMRIRDGKGVFEDRLDRPPDVDDLVPRFEEFVCFRGKVVWNAVLGC